jgi:hypothetical protein
MIDQTSNRIEKQETALRRQNRRRYAFQRMLEATDRVLWRLEEMNRDGVKTVPGPVRAEVQERLFRWRYPDWQDIEPDGDGSADFDYAS